MPGAILAVIGRILPRLCRSEVLPPAPTLIWDLRRFAMVWGETVRTSTLDPACQAASACAIFVKAVLLHWYVPPELPPAFARPAVQVCAI